MEKQKLNISCKCGEVTLDEFIDCLINGNLLRLVREGESAEAELQAAWATLYQEYMNQRGGEKNKYLFSLYKRTMILSAKLKAARMILDEEAPDEEKIALLKQVDYTGNINGIVSKIKRDTVMLTGAINELNRAKEGGDSEDRMMESDFTRWIISVSKFMGYRIDRHKVTVAEFLEMNREFEETIKAKEKQALKRK
jgi:hypothetical protein